MSAGPASSTAPGWQAIDTAERAAGAEQGRPRRKFTELDDFLRAAYGE